MRSGQAGGQEMENVEYIGKNFCTWRITKKGAKYGVNVIYEDDEGGPVDESDDREVTAPSIFVEDALFSWESPRYTS